MAQIFGNFKKEKEQVDMVTIEILVQQCNNLVCISYQMDVC